MLSPQSGMWVRLYALHIQHCSTEKANQWLSSLVTSSTCTCLDAPTVLVHSCSGHLTKCECFKVELSCGRCYKWSEALLLVGCVSVCLLLHNGCYSIWCSRTYNTCYWLCVDTSCNGRLCDDQSRVCVVHVLVYIPNDCMLCGLSHYCLQSVLEWSERLRFSYCSSWLAILSLKDQVDWVMLAWSQAWLLHSLTSCFVREDTYVCRCYWPWECIKRSGLLVIYVYVYIRM